MKELTIDSIYADNRGINEKFVKLMGDISHDLVFAKRDEGWSIAEIAEHVALVEEGMIRICAKLLSKSEAAKIEPNAPKNSEGVKLTENFRTKAEEIENVKLQAPEMTHPKGNAGVAETIGKLNENMRKVEELRPQFEASPNASETFPHPAMGRLTATEWLVLIGGHKIRHLRQIKRLLK